MLTWKTFKSRQVASPEVSRSKNRDIFSVILTPDRIPKFCIPSLEVDHPTFQPAQETSPGVRLSEEVIRRPRRVKSSPEISLGKDVHTQGTRGERDAGFASLALGAHSDPVTQAALSLPHLAKIMTPYGFLTLGECPKVHRKESLFFEFESTEFQLFMPKQTLPPVSEAQNPSRSLEISSDKGWKAKGCTNKHQKKLFQLLMKKHLPNIRKLKSNQASEDRFVIQPELLLSCPSASLQCSPRVQ
ncbi:putative C2 calcium-dependent domain-containing protein [Naja naja]|nr:putative C2 calcium-dependent domain-containing protein [Naja naja]